MLSPQVHLYRLLHRKDLSPTKRDNSSFEWIGKVETTASKRLNRLHVQLITIKNPEESFCWKTWWCYIAPTRDVCQKLRVQSVMRKQWSNWESYLLQTITLCHKYTMLQVHCGKLVYFLLLVTKNTEKLGIIAFHQIYTHKVIGLVLLFTCI